ncbi:hypothetical protein K438DRAFT_1762391 [Mycena galopus ATCC 62051]|nr:hypothetical protein K438DRAFT_1762391 [Mycena galopus ATCC 62051]
MFQDPALNALWRFQTELVPALECFPDDLWKRSVDSKKSTFVVIFQAFKRPPTSAEWERALFYWNRIKSFRIYSFDPKRISPAVCETLRISCPIQHPFRNLQEIALLDGIGCYDAQMSILPMFLSPRLNSISLFPGECMTQLSLLHTLGIKYPNLKESAFPKGFLALISNLHHLESLFISNTDIAILHHLAQISNLQHLESLFISNTDIAILHHLARLSFLKCLVIDGALPPGWVPDRDASTPRFPTLEALHLWSTTADIATTFVEAIDHHGLREIDIVFRTEFPDTQATARLYTAVEANHSHSTLNHSHIEDDGTSSRGILPPDDQFDRYIVGRQVLGILFPFANLTTIILEPFHGGSLSLGGFLRGFFSLLALRLDSRFRCSDIDSCSCSSTLKLYERERMHARWAKFFCGDLGHCESNRHGDSVRRVDGRSSRCSGSSSLDERVPTATEVELLVLEPASGWAQRRELSRRDVEVRSLAQTLRTKQKAPSVVGRERWATTQTSAPSVANGLDEDAELFRRERDLNFEQDFGRWFNTDDIGMEHGALQNENTYPPPDTSPPRIAGGSRTETRLGPFERGRNGQAQAQARDVGAGGSDDRTSRARCGAGERELASHSNQNQSERTLTADSHTPSAFTYVFSRLELPSSLPKVEGSRRYRAGFAVD